MNTCQTNPRSTRGFTLIELLVVIAVIAILAALLLPVGAKLQQKAAKARVSAELERVALAIDAYKQKLGYYPPDNPGNLVKNSLYFELLGSEFNGARYKTLDGSAAVNVDGTGKIPASVFGPAVTGIMNASRSAASDDVAPARAFLKDVKPTQYGEILVNATERVLVLGVKIDGPGNLMIGELNPFRYNSSNPTNNANTFDLWVDVVLGGKTNRISNWSDKAKQL